ncbi:hypothetical protein [Embleya sp. NPDC059259]
MALRRLAISVAAAAATVPLLLVATATQANAADNAPDQAQQSQSTCLWWYNVNSQVGGVPFALTQLKICLNSVHPNVVVPNGPIALPPGGILVPTTPIDADHPLRPVVHG